MAKEKMIDKVRKVLSESVSARNSDEELTILIWEKYYGVVGPDINIRRLFTLPTHKDIARIRAHIQNHDHQYVPTVPEVARARKWNEEKWRKLLGYPVYETDKQLEEVVEKHYSGRLF